MTIARSFLRVAFVAGLSAVSVGSVFADPLLRQTDLVSDVLPAQIMDPDLTNAWGISEGPGTPFWVSDNGTGVATLYSVPGMSSAVTKAPLTVTIPSGSAATAAPTGQVFNGTTGFKLSNGSKALFIFELRGWRHFSMEPRAFNECRDQGEQLESRPYEKRCL